MLSKVFRQAGAQLQKRSCERRSLHSYVHGASSLTLSFETTGNCLRRTVDKAPDQEFLVFRQQNIRKTFSQLLEDVGCFSFPRLHGMATVLPQNDNESPR
ncbi:hypothetical protein Y032_0024g1055 [Ancylostoma ceylanicum]|uniref:Uncharacterized protein n=1 Tax=Ancylostoma ceylanicum TaxID=53326 RepID=A0A016UVC5_9BILA|nr:hypothetical protein Y032_0024g1055 [Ancylostoma ceylanicum]